MSEEIKNQLDEIGNIVDSKIEKAFNQAKDNAKGEVESSLKSEIDNLSNEYLAKHDQMVKRFDDFEMSMKKDLQARSPKTFQGSITKAINEGALESVRSGSNSSARFEVKADMTMNEC